MKGSCGTFTPMSDDNKLISLFKQLSFFPSAYCFFLIVYWPATWLCSYRHALYFVPFIVYPLKMEVLIVTIELWITGWGCHHGSELQRDDFGNSACQAWPPPTHLFYFCLFMGYLDWKIEHLVFANADRTVECSGWALLRLRWSHV